MAGKDRPVGDQKAQSADNKLRGRTSSITSNKANIITLLEV